MSTINKAPDNYREVIDSGLLIRPKIPPKPGKQHMRVLLATPIALTWMKTKLPTLNRDGFVEGDVSPKQQAGFLLRSYVSGDRPDPPLPHEMRPNGEGIWEFRTDDLRFFGWFPKKGMFCLALCATKSDCKDHDLYDGFFAETKRIRETIGLYGASFVTGELDDVL